MDRHDSTPPRIDQQASIRITSGKKPMDLSSEGDLDLRNRKLTEQ
jgi:hypothetical protein